MNYRGMAEAEAYHKGFLDGQAKLKEKPLFDVPEDSWENIAEMWKKEYEKAEAKLKRRDRWLENMAIWLRNKKED